MDLAFSEIIKEYGDDVFLASQVVEDEQGISEVLRTCQMVSTVLRL
jgi:hypothetical protein